jgi:hypothetical protein
MTSLIDPFQQVLRDAFGIKPLVYALPVTRTKGEIFTKSTIQKQEDGKYRVSITKFVDGNTDSISDEVDTLDAAKKFIADNK